MDEYVDDGEMGKNEKEGRTTNEKINRDHKKR